MGLKKKEDANNSITGNIIWKFLESFLAQLASFIVSLVLARILAPDDYGTVAMVLVFVNVANAFFLQGLNVALIQNKDADQIDFSSALYANIFLSLVLYAIVFASAPYIAHFYDKPILKPILRILGIKLIISAANAIQQAYVSKKMIFRKSFWATIFGTITSGIGGLIIAFKGGGAWALVAQHLINVLIDTIIISFSIRWKPSLVFSCKRLKYLLGYSWKITLDSVSETVSVQLRNLVIGKVYSSADLGFYTKAQQFPNLIVNNIGDSIGAVLFPAMSNNQYRREYVTLLMRKSARISSYIIFPILFGMGLCSDEIIVCLLGEKWIESSIYLKLVCGYTLLTVGMYPRHQALKAIGRSDVYMYEHMVVRIINFIILFIVYRISVMAIVIACIAGGVAMALTVMYTSKRFNNYLYIDQFKDIANVIVICIAMCIPVCCLSVLSIENQWIVLAVKVLVGGGIYVLLSAFIKPEGYIFIKEKLKVLLRRRNN